MNHLQLLKMLPLIGLITLTIVSAGYDEVAAAGSPKKPSSTTTTSSDPKIKELTKQLQAKVTPDGPFDQALYEQVASALTAADSQAAATQDLVANARDFAAGKVRASMFVAYLKEALPTANASRKEGAEGLTWLQAKASDGDLWAKFFLARAHFYSDASTRENAKREQFAGQGFSQDSRRYWEAYKQAIKDESFAGSYNEVEKLGQEGVEANFAPLINLLGAMQFNGIGMPKDETKGLTLYRQAAEAGFPIAMTNLAAAYESGVGVAKDEAEAVQWYRQAAELGHARAMAVLGDRYASGQGVAKDDRVAVQWYRKAAELGNEIAMFNLGKRYANGQGVAKDDRVAVQWYRKAAELGHSAAMFNLGVSYASGQGVAKDEAVAVQWYRKAAELGQSAAMFNLGVSYASGQGVAKDEAVAVQWYRKAAELGHARAMAVLGDRYATGQGVAKDDAVAVQWYRKAAELGNWQAAYYLGFNLTNGIGVKKDDAEAARWYLKSAEAGHAGAMSGLGLVFLNGQGAAKDDTEAFKWFQKAAESGNSTGMINLGFMYGSGRGVKKNDAEAVRWYQKAAALGEPAAMSNLGVQYENGSGVTKDLKQALEWYQKAAARGHAEATKSVERLQTAIAGTNEKPVQVGGSTRGWKSAQEWAEAYRNAKFINSSEFLKRLPPVRLAISVSPGLTSYISAENLRTMLYGLVQAQGIRIDTASSVTLNLEARLQSGGVVQEEWSRDQYGITHDELRHEHPVHLVSLLVQFEGSTPIYRKGEFYYLPIIITNSFTYTYWIGGGDIGEDMRRKSTWQHLLDTTFSDLRSRTTANADDLQVWQSTLWPLGKDHQMHAKYVKALSSKSDGVERIFTNNTDVSAIEVTFEEKAGMFLNENKVKSNWTYELSGAGFAVNDAGRLKISHFIGCEKINASKFGVIGLGGIAPMSYGIILNQASVTEEDVVFELDGEFVRRPITLWESLVLQGTIWKEVESTLSTMVSGGIRDFAKEARYRR